MNTRLFIDHRANQAGSSASSLLEAEQPRCHNQTDPVEQSNLPHLDLFLQDLPLQRIFMTQLSSLQLICAACCTTYHLRVRCTRDFTPAPLKLLIVIAERSTRRTLY
jgi:hypothetical protein